MNGLAYRNLTLTATNRLIGHQWRGNVRELENVIHRAVLLAIGPNIEAGDVELTRQSDGITRRSTNQRRTGGVASLVGRRMDDVERDLIIETLGHTLGQSHHRTPWRRFWGFRSARCVTSFVTTPRRGVAVPPPAASAA